MAIVPRGAAVTIDGRSVTGTTLDLDDDCFQTGYQTPNVMGTEHPTAWVLNTQGVGDQADNG